MNLSSTLVIIVSLAADIFINSKLTFFFFCCWQKNGDNGNAKAKKEKKNWKSNQATIECFHFSVLQQQRDEENGEERTRASTNFLLFIHLGNDFFVNFVRPFFFFFLFTSPERGQTYLIFLQLFVRVYLFYCIFLLHLFGIFFIYFSIFFFFSKDLTTFVWPAFFHGKSSAYFFSPYFSVVDFAFRQKYCVVVDHASNQVFREKRRQQTSIWSKHKHAPVFSFLLPSLAETWNIFRTLKTEIDKLHLTQLNKLISAYAWMSAHVNVCTSWCR